MFPPTLYGILLYICTYNARGCTFTYTVYVYATSIHFFVKNKALRLHCICVCLYVCVSRCLSLYVCIYGEIESFFFLLQVFFPPLPSLISHIYIRYPILPTLFILERKLYTLKSPTLHAKTDP